MKTFFKKYSFALWALYIPVYFISFIYLEKRNDVNFNYIHCALDDKIPFMEAFIVPYLLWFVYIFVSVAYFVLFERKEFNRLAWYLACGMTMFLIISYIYPNALDLRPAVYPRDNIFTDMVKKLQSTDTPTNVLPSIHVYNTLCVTTALLFNERFSKSALRRGLIIVLSVLIILSTMLLKQHSVIDVFSAFLMAAVFFVLIYVLPQYKEKDKNTKNITA
ncbi:MAG: phosphatase PAP2 family protein [Eubacterium sp.]|nr:phosphatase PAP2 family protein [Eubacterium sp.]